MKKLIVLIGIIALFGCEKEACWSCAKYKTYHGSAPRFQSEGIYCDTKPVNKSDPGGPGSGGGIIYDCTLISD